MRLALGILLALGVGLLESRADAQDPQPVDSPEVTAMEAALAPLRCPLLTGFSTDPDKMFRAGRITSGDGVYRLQDTLVMECQYRSVADPGGPLVRISFSFVHSQAERDATCPVEPREDRGDPVRVNDVILRPDAYVTIGYTIETEALAVSPNVEEEIRAVVVPNVDFLVPFASPCQLSPVQITCPPVDGFAVAETEQSTNASLLRATCRYDGTEGGTASITVDWATERSDVAARIRVCIDPGEQLRPRTNMLGGDGSAAIVNWLRYNSETDFDAAAIELRNQVLEQAASCEGVPIESRWTPLPPYLADEFSPERIGGATLLINQFGGSQPTVAPATTAPATTAPGTTAPATVAPATTASATTEPPAAAAGDVESAAGRVAAVAAPSGLKSWVRSALRILSIVMLVVSLLGLALTFYMMRKQSRIRPRLDVARLVIVLAVAGVSILVFSRGAPVWAVAVAVGSGLVLGYLQGRNLSIERKEKGLYAKRNATALVAFGAGLIVTQLAGLLNRTGVIVVGLALSFLSAAMLAGVMAGRRPVLANARKATATAVLVVLIGGALLATALPPQRSDAQNDDTQNEPPVEDVRCGSLTPGERCAGHEQLLDLVDWSAVQFSGGLFWDLGKPPAVIEVPRGFDAPPAPITRTVEWQNGVPLLENALVKGFQLTETYTFELTAEGVCCGVLYSGSGTETDLARVPVDEYDPTVLYTRTDQSGLGETNTHVAEGRLHDLAVLGDGRSGELVGLGGTTAGLPFSEQKDLNRVSVTERCGRYLAESVPNMLHNGEFTTLLLNGEPQSERSADALAMSYAATSCDIPGFSYDDALAQLPPVQAPPRSKGCPVRQQLVPALAEGGYELTDTLSVAKLFTDPNGELCSGGGLASPMNFGSGVRGGTRSEFMFEYSIPETQTVWGDDSALSGLNPAIIAPEDRCEVDEQGRPLRLEGDARCNLMTMHQLDDGWVSISYDNQHIDGPNTTLRVSLPWGAYRYRCHHCEPDDPEIERFLGQFHDFSTDWEPPASGTEIIPDDPVFNDEPAPEPSAADELAEQAEELGIDPELAELFIDDDADEETRAAALAALVGLMGSLGLAGTALAESGLSASDLAGAFRDGGLGGLDDALDREAAEREEEAARAAEREATAVVDERGERLYPDDDGLYPWDDGDTTRQVSREELQELIGAERAASAERDARHRSIVREQNSDAAAAQRFADLGERIIEQNDALMAEIRGGWDNVDAMQAFLDERARRLAALEAAEAVMDRDTEHLGWDIAWGALAGAGDEIAGLPGEIVDATRFVVQATVNWENARVVAETFGVTVYDAAGMMLGGTFGDGAQSVGRGAVAVGGALWEDPSLVTMLIPGRDLLDITDGNRTLGGRLASLGLGLVDVYGVGTGLGLLPGTDELADTARAATRASEAVEGGATAARTGEAASDVATTATRLPDAALDPVLVQTRNQIDDAIAAAEREAARRTAETGRIPPFTAREVYADVPEVRALYQGAGPQGIERLGALEAAGGLDPHLSQSVLGMYDELTGAANRLGATEAIDDLARFEGVTPRTVLVGDSGSSGLTRSVFTDSDRTVLAVFDDVQLDNWAGRNLVDEDAVGRLTSQGVPVDEARATVLQQQRAAVAQQLQAEGVALEEANSIALRQQRAAANQRLQNRYRDFHRRNVELALNDPSDPAVRLARAGDMSLDDAIARRRAMGYDDADFASRRVTADNVGTESYADLGSPDGPADSYSRGVTASRQAEQGSTRVITTRVGPDGSVSVAGDYTTSGRALVDESELQQLRHRGEMSATPTRMVDNDFSEVLRQQRLALSHHDDAKSAAKAVRRMTSLGGRGTSLGTDLSDAEKFRLMFGDPTPEKRQLIEAAHRIRGNPLETKAALDALNGGRGMTQDEFAQAVKDMVNSAPGAAAT